MSDDGQHPCWVAKGPCGHYYYAAVVEPITAAETGKKIAQIQRRAGHTVELKTVQFVRDGGLKWTKECKAGICKGSSSTGQSSENKGEQQ